jgi:hypothetical protein
MCGEFFPVFKKLAATEIYSITLGGSHGKGLSDHGSDFDFRIYYEKIIEPEKMGIIFEEVKTLCEKWAAKNVKVDGIFPRAYAEVDEQLDLWLSGKGKLVPYEWTVWGYTILTDIYNQQIIEDPYGKAEEWKKRLAVYPDALKESLINHYSSSLEYWKNDYHYQNKVNRKDIVFLAYITCRLIQDIIQIIYALNEFYYPGDGMNLEYTPQFTVKPQNFEERVAAVLRTSEADDTYTEQYKNVISLIDDTLLLVAR